MTRDRSVGGAEMTGAEVTGAEVTGVEMVWGRSVYGPRWFGAEVSVNLLFTRLFVYKMSVSEKRE